MSLSFAYLWEAEMTVAHPPSFLGPEDVPLYAHLCLLITRHFKYKHTRKSFLKCSTSVNKFTASDLLDNLDQAHQSLNYHPP